MYTQCSIVNIRNTANTNFLYSVFGSKLRTKNQTQSWKHGPKHKTLRKVFQNHFTCKTSKQDPHSPWPSTSYCFRSVDPPDWSVVSTLLHHWGLAQIDCKLDNLNKYFKIIYSHKAVSPGYFSTHRIYFGSIPSTVALNFLLHINIAKTNEHNFQQKSSLSIFHLHYRNFIISPSTLYRASSVEVRHGMGWKIPQSWKRHRQERYQSYHPLTCAIMLVVLQFEVWFALALVAALVVLADLRAVAISNQALVYVGTSGSPVEPVSIAATAAEMTIG